MHISTAPFSVRDAQSCHVLEMLRPVTMNDQPLIQRYLSAYPPQISELTFTNLYCWAEARHHLFLEYDGHLLVTFRDAHCTLNFYPPVGPDPVRIMHTIFSGLKKYCWARIPEHPGHTVAQKDMRLILDRSNSDYVYSLSDLRALSGKKYDGKRNFIKRFEALNPEVRPLTADDADACMRIQERWLEFRGKNDPSMLDESTALMNAMRHFDALAITGIGVEVDSHLAGFAIGEPLNGDTFVEHFEKGLKDYPGIYPFLLRQFARSVPQRFTSLNREQDLGIPSIRTSKESWQPSFVLRKFSIRISP
ncbi:MAG: phosphatidylglycerol lysyltransferase domain-containing protein [Candidatus Peribacteraceae bacterium]|nr:phosphatidylglycerol lysyltransferase domain-containing protein [Candidatus Peribacteraceae bacterium]